MYVSLLPHFRHAHLQDLLLSHLLCITNEPGCTNALLNCHLPARVNTDILGQRVLQRGTPASYRLRHKSSFCDQGYTILLCQVATYKHIFHLSENCHDGNSTWTLLHLELDQAV